MKKIFLTLISIILISQQSIALREHPQKESFSHTAEPFNISSWSVEDAAMQAKITSVRPSPDGKYVLVENYPPYVDDSAIQPSEIALINNKTKELIWTTQSDWLCSKPQWAPDGKHISFLRLAAGGQYTLYLTPISKNEPIEVAQGNWNISDYSWSPDSKRIALLISAEEPSIEGQNYVTIGPLKRKTVLSLISLNLPLKRHIEPNPLSFAKSSFPNLFIKSNTMISWSPDNENVVFVGVNPENESDGIFTINIPSEKITLIADKGKPEFPMYSPDGKSIAYVASIEGEDNPSPEKKFPTKRRHVFLKKVGEQDSQKLSPTFNEQPTLIGWFPDGQHLLLSEGYKTTNRLYKLPINRGAPEILNTNEEEFISLVSLSPSRNGIGFLSESLNAAPVAAISPIDNFFPQSLSRDFSQTISLKNEIVQWKSFDGKEIEGILIYPSFYEAGKSYPLVVAAHDGPYGAWEQRFMGNCYNGFPFSPAVLASQGYLVLLPNIRGSSNYGIDFARANQKDLGGGDFKDLLSGVDFLIEKKIADPEKLAIWGWGYGGYLAAWATTQTNRFKAALVGTGIIDFIFFSNDSREDLLQSYLGGPFWKNKKLWLERSPIMHVGKINTPTLLQYSLNDKDFPLAQGQELFSVLKGRDIPVKMMVFKAEGHRFQYLAASREVALTSLINWLDEYLKPPSQNDKLSKQATEKK